MRQYMILINNEIQLRVQEVRHFKNLECLREYVSVWRVHRASAWGFALLYFTKNKTQTHKCLLFHICYLLVLFQGSFVMIIFVLFVLSLIVSLLKHDMAWLHQGIIYLMIKHLIARCLQKCRLLEPHTAEWWLSYTARKVYKEKAVTLCSPGLADLSRLCWCRRLVWQHYCLLVICKITGLKIKWVKLLSKISTITIAQQYDISMRH